MTTLETPVLAGNGKVAIDPGVEYVVKRLFFPSHGRLDRRVNHRSNNGQEFVGMVWSFWWGPFCAFLVYRKQT
jgi:hypothetical protein